MALFSLNSSFGQDMSIPCSAFARHYSDWEVLAPVILNIGGKLLAPTVGTTFVAGSTTNGISMSNVLDHACGR